MALAQELRPGGVRLETAPRAVEGLGVEHDALVAEDHPELMQAGDAGTTGAELVKLVLKEAGKVPDVDHFGGLRARVGFVEDPPMWRPSTAHA